MLIIGGDIGHKNAKMCFGHKESDTDIFKSTVGDVRNDVLGKNKDIIVTYNGRELAIGTDYGAYSVEDDKSKDEVFKICLFTAIARVMTKDVENISLVTGLPINYYKRYKDALVESLEGETIKLIYRERTKVINFSHIKPYPESAGVVLLDKDNFKGPVIVIDIGGRTVDVSYFEDKKLVKTGSYDLGMLTVYSTIVKHINEKYPTDYSVLDGEKIIENKFIVAEDKEIVFNPERFLKEHAAEILRRVRLDFPWKTSKKKFIGGGSIDLKDFIPSIVSSTDIFANARAFYTVGVGKYGSY